jgi:serine protease Do
MNTWNGKQMTYRKIYFGWILALTTAFALSAAAQAGDLPDFTQIVPKVSAAVVNISTSQTIKQRRPQMPHDMPGGPDGQDGSQPPLDDFFRRFFGDPQGGGDGGDTEEFSNRSLGSGFIISSDGYILTNDHVIKDADEIIVRLSNREEFKAKVVGSDSRSDVALIKIDAKDLPTVKIGHSSDLKVGQWVLAIGSPFDFDHSVTAGIVSALGRSLPNENYVPFIQTDVAINPGNSGGPLFNLNSEVVGINSQIYSRTGGFMGLSFTIPIDLAMNVVDQLKNKGSVTRGWLGILIQDVTRDLAESFGMDRPGGALVAQVLPDSPAEKAGIKVGDVVMDFNGTAINDSASLPPIVGQIKVGEEVPVKVLRDGKTRTVEVKIGELPPEEEIKLADRGPESAAANRLGAVVSELTSDQRNTLDKKKTGVYVEDVKNGPARSAGLRRGDIILMINNVDVKSVSHFQKLVKDLPKDKSVPMLVQRGSGPMFLALKMPEKG